MKTIIHDSGSIQITEFISDGVLISTTEDLLDLLSEITSNYLILYTDNFTQDYFDLSSRKLGELLQKLSNYHINLAIIGDFTQYKSSTLPDLIYESNSLGNYLFLPSLSSVLDKWHSITS